ncbi:hypothetical protein HU200_045721 [Digitaria exilis]|uniref:C3H1-type domain-containing protein n=1 Tax=Digitaria exilis TaxID=1010633 RepID=A0A835EBT5_9POAL|nr:hypothetical protein HU200_045721 [Digitaria exilis]
MATGSGGGDSSDPTTWFAWAHRGHRLWAAMPDAFWVYMYKVHRCPQLGTHDWTRAPVAATRAASPTLPSPARRAARRKGAAPACVHGGLRCRYAHGVFELWLHPARFRTVLCDAGASCPRPVCFFAHSGAELRRENDNVPLAGMPPPPPHVPRHRSPASTSSPVSFPRQVDLAMLAMPGKVRLMHRGAAAATSASSSSSSTATVAVATVAALPSATSPDDDEEPAGKNHNRRGSEEGSVAGRRLPALRSNQGHGELVTTIELAMQAESTCVQASCMSSIRGLGWIRAATRGCCALLLIPWSYGTGIYRADWNSISASSCTRKTTRLQTITAKLPVYLRCYYDGMRLRGRLECRSTYLLAGWNGGLTPLQNLPF